MAKSMKRESGGSSIKTERGNVEAGTPSTTDRRALRSRYHAFKIRISDKKKDISRVDADKFYSIIDEFESLHQLVQKPREQVADAETLLNIANTLVASFKVHGDGVSPSDFVSCILRDFVQRGLVSCSTEEDGKSICWKDIGVAVSHVFRRGPECCTMLGPMNSELRQRKHNVHRKHVRPTEEARPEELGGAVMEEKTGTDKNMSVMFDILKKNGRAKLESLVMNRSSFSQTVENLFALSFLVKDGRAEITIDQKDCHIVAPRNAPPASAVANGDVSYSHFVFRFDFKDWKLMKESSKMGEELMQRREEKGLTSCSQAGSEAEESQVGGPKALSRNDGLVKQERAAVEGSSENENATDGAAAIRIRKGKRKAFTYVLQVNGACEGTYPGTGPAPRSRGPKAVIKFGALSPTAAEKAAGGFSGARQRQQGAAKQRGTAEGSGAPARQRDNRGSVGGQNLAICDLRLCVCGVGRLLG